MPDYAFPRSRRLLKPAEFDRVFGRRCSRGDGLIVVYACENDVTHARLGLVVSKKAGNAVARGRWKRCLREAFRLAQRQLPVGVDIVVLPRSQATPAMPLVLDSLVKLTATLAQRLKATAPSTTPGVDDRNSPP